MPWNSDYYPPSMSHLPEPVREKAIEIANALVEEGMEEGNAIEHGWCAASHGLETRH